MNRLAYLPIVLLLLPCAMQRALAEPAWGGNCLSCHGELQTGLLSVFGDDTTADPDESGTGAPDRGLLLVFQAAPGETKALLVDLVGLSANDTYAIQLTRLRFPGVEDGGQLVYTGDCAWPEWGEDANYYSDPVRRHRWGTGPTDFTFEIDVEPGAAYDYYDLVFAVAGKFTDGGGLFYAEEHFYMEVVFAPCDLDNDGDVNEDDFAVFLAAYGRSIGEPEYREDCDFDGDGTVTIVDYQSWLQCYRSFIGDVSAPAPVGTLGDYDSDTDVDLVDFGEFQCCISHSPDRALPCVLKFDFNADGTVDLDDLTGFVAVCTGP